MVRVENVVERKQKQGQYEGNLQSYNVKVILC